VFTVTNLILCFWYSVSKHPLHSVFNVWW